MKKIMMITLQIIFSLLVIIVIRIAFLFIILLSITVALACPWTYIIIIIFNCSAVYYFAIFIKDSINFLSFNAIKIILIINLF